MNVQFSIRIFTIAACILATQPALATNGPAPTPTESGKAPKSRDPNRMICETSLETGSRLAKKRVCLTAAEWQERRDQDRLLVDRAQVQRSIESPN
jgi:hypothetical protein